MEIAVTGGSGFIGSHVVDRLVNAGHQVRVLDVARPHRNDVQWNPVDITRLSQVAGVLHGCDAVMHLAAMANVNDVARAPGESVDLNVMGTATMLEGSRLAGVKHFVFASTVWVYEATDDLEVDETTPLRPDRTKHLYMAEKIAGEMLVHSYGRLYNIPTTVLRYGIPFGPRMREELVLAIFMKKAFHGEPLTVAGDGMQFRNFVYVEDLADAHARVLERGATGTFNLEGSQKVAIVEMAEAVNRRIPTSAGIVHTEARPGDYTGRVVSAARAKQELDWEPTTTFEEGLERTLEWFKAKWAELATV